MAKKSHEKNTAILNLLEEGLSVEEVPGLENLDELEELLDSSELDEDFKNELLRDVKILKKDTVKHSMLFTQMLKAYIKKGDD